MATSMILEQLTRLQRALAERVPANPAAERNVRLANALEADLRRYFRDLELAFPYAEIERLYYSALAEADRDYVLQRIGLTEEEAQGLLPLSALAQMVDEAERKHGREWVDQNAALLRDEWLHIQKM